MSKFTKGEWKFEDGLIVNEDYRLIAVLENHHEDTDDEYNANARLIVEAKNMYNALVCVNGLLKDPRITGVSDFLYKWNPKISICKASIF